jgi:ribosomal protein S18 acetylase RimI-like enzyme
MLSRLDNIFWNCLSGPHARFATGTGDVRRYAPGFSPIIGAADPHNPDLRTLEAFCAPGESIYIDVWSGACPSGWVIEREARMFKMVWDAPVPAEDAAPEAVLLAPAQAQLALDLARLTNPGPFGIRTPELGEYFGLFESGKLVALAGERTQQPGLHEISGICTHPEFQGRGLARKLTLKLIRRHAQRGELTYLHVMGHNTGARALYRKMGFRDYLETTVRVIAPCGFARSRSPSE